MCSPQPPQPLARADYAWLMLIATTIRSCCSYPCRCMLADMVKENDGGEGGRRASRALVCPCDVIIGLVSVSRSRAATRAWSSIQQNPIPPYVHIRPRQWHQECTQKVQSTINTQYKHISIGFNWVLHKYILRTKSRALARQPVTIRYSFSVVFFF